MQTKSVTSGRRCVRGARILAALTLAVLAGACSSIPQTDLTQYREAFAQTQEASEAVLLQYDQALKEARTFVAQRQARPEAARAPYPTRWEEAAAPPAAVDAIEVRRQALRAVARYNDVLGQLAEGKSVEQVRGAAGGLASSLAQLASAAAGAAVPGLGAITGLISTFAGELERARLRAEFEKAVRNGAPTIDKILDALADDVGSIYNLRAQLAERERRLTVGRMTAQVATLRSTIASHRAPPASVASVADLQSQVNDLLLPARGELVGYPYRFASGGASAPEFGAAVNGTAQLAVTELRKLNADYNANVEQIRALTSMLGQYRTMLGRTKSGLAQLVRALDQPQDLEATAEDLMKLAFGIKRDVETLQLALRAR